MDVVDAAWRGAGSPAGSAGVIGVCARCSARAALVAAGSVVSKHFTGYETWASPGRGGLCPGCTWAYRTPSLRSVAHVVRREGPSLVALDRAQLLAVLRAGAIEAGCAVVVPLRPGRQHVITSATWGRVATGAGPMPWRVGDVARLEVVARLRAAGFGPRMITERVPAYPVLRTLSAHQVCAVLADWAALAPWRGGGAWLEVALHATTTETAR